MGKRIVAQRRGKGSLTYRSPSHRHVSSISSLRDGTFKIADIIHAPGRNAPLLVLESSVGERTYGIAFNGAAVGMSVVSSQDASPEVGNTLPLGKIPDGTSVYNIENRPGEGGKFCRTAGSSALIVTHGSHVTLKMPSGEMKLFDPRCRATIGKVAGSGAKDIVVLKAGYKVRMLKSKAKRPYSVRGVAMNAVNHPHGGGNHQHVGGPNTVSRNAPPGKKVGRLSPKRRKR